MSCFELTLSLSFKHFKSSNQISIKASVAVYVRVALLSIDEKKTFCSVQRQDNWHGQKTSKRASTLLKENEKWMAYSLQWAMRDFGFLPALHSYIHALVGDLFFVLSWPLNNSFLGRPVGPPSPIHPASSAAVRIFVNFVSQKKKLLIYISTDTSPSRTWSSSYSERYISQGETVHYFQFVQLIFFFFLCALLIWMFGHFPLYMCCGVSGDCGEHPYHHSSFQSSIYNSISEMLWLILPK